MLSILISWVVLSVAFLITAKVLPGMQIKSFGGAFVAAAIFGLLNFLIGWLLFAILGLVSMGLGFLLAFITRWIVNAILLKVTDAMSKSLEVRGVSTTLLGALMISAIGTIGEWLVRMAF